jgi:23S rRNA pseudouridine1911/1915/1917 synthase
MLLAGMHVQLHTIPAHAHPCQLDEAAIIYRDKWLIAINKPVGTYVDATPWDADNHLRTALATILAQHDYHPPLHPAHRLDRDTTGVLLFTHHPHANANLQKMFVQQRAQKYYLCHVRGQPAWDTYSCVSGHGRSDRGRFRVYDVTQVGQQLPNGDSVKYMHTTFQVLARYPDDTSILLAIPHTGRTHQIRLHAVACGLPLMGDRSYGDPVDTVPAHRLHAWQLHIPHPIHDSPMRLCAPLPDWIPADLALPHLHDTIE